MSVNSSTNSSLHPPPYICHTSVNVSTLTTLTINYILLLPLFILVLFVGYQRSRKQRSVATAAMTSHSDIFTYNMIVLEILGILATAFYSYGLYTNQPNVLRVMFEIFALISPGQTLFHLLTCVERYLAVVHPITYLGLRKAGGVRIRNISIGCIWLLCCASLGVSMISASFYAIFISSFFILALIVVSYCSLSVLRVLIRPGPGDVGGNRERADQTKQRAFYTIMAIMGALLLRFFSVLVTTAMYAESLLSMSSICLVILLTAWFSLPSSLVLPLLFLHRAGKLPGFKHNSELG